VKKVLLIFVLLAFVSCACPKYNVVDRGMSPFGPIIIQTNKDHYNEKNHSLEKFLNSDGWITLEEFEAWRAEQIKKYQEQKKLEKSY